MGGTGIAPTAAAAAAVVDSHRTAAVVEGPGRRHCRTSWLVNGRERRSDDFVVWIWIAVGFVGGGWWWCVGLDFGVGVGLSWLLPRTLDSSSNEVHLVGIRETYKIHSDENVARTGMTTFICP